MKSKKRQKKARGELAYGPDGIPLLCLESAKKFERHDLQRFLAFWNAKKIALVSSRKYNFEHNPGEYDNQLLINYFSVQNSLCTRQVNLLEGVLRQEFEKDVGDTTSN